MAKERMINTKFWDDSYIVSLDPIEKLLYLYFLTNPLTNIAGVYEIQLRRISFDTGIDKDMVQKIIDRFTADDKIFFIDGWIAIKNFSKHQRDNPSVKKGIEMSLKFVPVAILDRLCTDSDSLSHLNLNLNLNSNLNLNHNTSKNNYGEFGNVLLKDEEYQKLISSFGEKNTKLLIAELDTGIASKGYKYKSHYATILNWARRKYQENKLQTKKEKYIA